MERSDTIGKLTEALAKAQQAFLPIKRTEKVDYETTRGRKKYNYAPLSEVIDSTRKGLTDNGLAIMQPTRVIEDRLFVETWLGHSSGEYVQCEMFVGNTKELPQEEGSALTYKRRYSLSSLLGIASEDDDDAEAAQGRDKKPAEKTAPASSDSKHWCQEHKTVFFMKGKMKSYAHPIKGDDGKDTGDWCHEHKHEPGQLKVEDMKSTKDEQPLEDGTSEGQKPVSPRDPESVKTFTLLYKACHEDFGMQPGAVFSQLGVKTQNELTMLPKDCYKKIVESQSKEVK